MKKYLIYIIIAGAMFCLGAAYKKSTADRLTIAVHDYVEVLDKTIDYKSLSLADQNQLKQAKREIEKLYRDVKYDRD